jgi:hypothetical protein
MVRFDIVAMRRSGQHPIIRWISGHFATTTFHNDVGEEGCDIRRELNDSFGIAGIYTLKGYGEKDCEIFNYEDQLVDCIEPSLIILRDPANCFASRLKAGFDLKDRLNLDLWKNHATAILSGSRHILFDWWFMSKSYREKISEELGVPHVDAFITELSPFGLWSSFDGRKYAGRADQMGVMKRWKQCCDDEEYVAFLRKMMGDKELVEMAREIFGNVFSRI